jgi:hypothetical protein
LSRPDLISVESGPTILALAVTVECALLAVAAAIVGSHTPAFALPLVGLLAAGIGIALDTLAAIGTRQFTHGDAPTLLRREIGHALSEGAVLGARGFNRWYSAAARAAAEALRRRERRQRHRVAGDAGIAMGVAWMVWTLFPSIGATLEASDAAAFTIVVAAWLAHARRAGTLVHAWHAAAARRRRLRDHAAALAGGPTATGRRPSSAVEARP